MMGLILSPIGSLGRVLKRPGFKRTGDDPPAAPLKRETLQSSVPSFL
jgi:hypothetical protein